MLERNRAEFQLWTRKMEMVFAIALIYLASSVGGNVTPKLPETGGIKAVPEMSENGKNPYDDYGVVDLNKVRIPLKKTDECPIPLPAGIVVKCHSLALKDGGGQLDIGDLNMAHNVSYVLPGGNELPNFRGVNPGGEIMRHEGECVRFGKSGMVAIGKFERVKRFVAWLEHKYSRFVTSAEPSTSTSPALDISVYVAPLTPCGEPAVATPTEFTTYTVVAGDSLTKIARKLKVTPQQLAIANDRKLDGIIRVGEVLIAP